MSTNDTRSTRLACKCGLTLLPVVNPKTRSWSGIMACEHCDVSCRRHGCVRCYAIKVVTPG